MQVLGKILIFSGLLLVCAGALALLAVKFKFSFLGRLPGDIFIENKNFTFYFPLASSLVISLCISLLFWLFSRR